jgi:threonine dehydratase
MSTNQPKESLRDQLFHEILQARQRVYEVGDPTPLEVMPLREGVARSGLGQVYLKREDLSPINAYKWRGAYNRMAILSTEERAAGVVAASAGNHAQGVALAASRLQCKARIYMPLSTPFTKQAAVARHGGDQVEIILTGDTYDVAASAAKEYSAEHSLVFVHPYDDLATMGGQGTLADEIVMAGKGAFDVVYLQIGGGGMAAAVACWLKTYYPNIRVVGVEGVDQASMQAAIQAGEPVSLEYLDVFCDGTAVRRAGNLTYQICRDLIDDYMQVTNEEVCAAIQTLWEGVRCIPEPSGAMGLAGLMKDPNVKPDARALCVVCGANIDFSQLAWVARHAGIGAHRRRYYRFKIGAEGGTMLHLLQTCLSDVNIIEFQFGKTDTKDAWPVIGFDASPIELDLLDKKLSDQGVEHQDVTSSEEVDFRIIPYEPALFMNPFFIKLEFPERAGALHDFLTTYRKIMSICYFNYVYTGERVGRAMLGFEFESEALREQFVEQLGASEWNWREISDEVLSRILK